MEAAVKKIPKKSVMTFSRPSEGTLVVQLGGDWRIGEQVPSSGKFQDEIESSDRIQGITFDTKELSGWDSTFLTFLNKVSEQCSRKNILVDKLGLPDGVQRLLALASAVPEKKGTRTVAEEETFLTRIGQDTVDFFRTAGELLDFIGQAFVAFLRLLRGKASYRKTDLVLTLQECGVQAFSIVSLISLLVGMILGFVGAVQLKLFGAEIYVADLVGVAMVRVMSAVMTGIIMAGRTGGAFAAQLGTMEVNEEIDALRTLGINPMEFLVLPRMLALMLMMPLLCLYADLMGILGGVIVAIGMLDINMVQYYQHTRDAVGQADLWIGLFQSAMFGVLVALAGCMRGMQCGRSASAVGDAATSAVVTGIVSIIVATSIITVICSMLGI